MLDITDYIYFDIETAGKYKDVYSMEKDDPTLFGMLLHKYKSSKDVQPAETIEDYYRRICGLIAEYGQIVCVSVGIVKPDGTWRTTSYTGSEETILKQVSQVFQTALEHNKIPCGFNIITFDLPWLNKKMIKYGIRIPYNLLLFNKKPWELKVLDLIEVWKMSGKSWSTLAEVSNELGIENPKDKMHGDMVHDTFWGDGDVDSIACYCEGDVIVVKQIVEKMVISFD